MTAVIQISDTHIVPNGALVSGRLETAAPLKRLVQRIIDIRNQVGGIEAVLVSGDISDDGSMESYQRFKDILGMLDMPIYIIPGNHDAREPMRTEFQAHGYLPDVGKLNWHKQIGNIHIVGLDTLVEGEGGGELDLPTLKFFRDTLSSIKREPVLLTLHHPPFKTGIGYMDAIGLKNRAEFCEILSEFDGALRVVCGHIHCMMTVNMGRHIVITAPSPCSSFAMDTRLEAPVGFMEVEDGCLLHRWDNGFQTIRIGPTAGAGPFPF